MTRHCRSTYKSKEKKDNNVLQYISIFFTNSSSIADMQIVFANLSTGAKMQINLYFDKLVDGSNFL